MWVGADGSKYDGEWYKDEKTGKGTLTYRDGSVYSGEWQQNMVRFRVFGVLLQYASFQTWY